MKILLILIIMILSVSLVSAVWFRPEIPPGVAPEAVCLKTGCNMTGDIWMNDNSIYNVTLYDVTLINATQSFSWNNLDDIPAGFADNIDNDTQYTDLNEFTNTPGYITDGNTNWDNIYNLAYLDNITWEYLQNIPAGFADNIDNDSKYYNLSEFNNDLNISGSQITGYDWWTNVGSIDEADAYFFWNITNQTLQLYVNGEIQQDWGASTTIYQEATFLDNIFGDGSTLLNVCLPNGLTVNGQPCNATSVFYTDEIWINNLNGNATFNESKLNETILLFINVSGFDGFFTSLDFTGTVGFDDFVDNDTISRGAGKYLYNVEEANITNIYINETTLITTIDNRTGIFELNMTINVVGGVGTNTSIFSFPRLAEILEITVTPSTLTNKYRFSANGSTTGLIIDRDRIPHTGEWFIAHRGTIIQSETITAYITEAIIDESFNINLKYRQ